jgi:hypothetical protein
MEEWMAFFPGRAAGATRGLSRLVPADLMDTCTTVKPSGDPG